MAFEITHKDNSSRARRGRIITPSGRTVETPAYAIVGTHAEVRTLSAEDIPETRTQLIIANTYHLWRTLEDLDSFPGLHRHMNLPDTALMTDSGGFQVFSLGFGREHGVGKVLGGEQSRSGENLTRITDKGVEFKDKGETFLLTPELSMDIQEKLGADIIFAFDECTSPRHSYEYQSEALERTHAWARICLDARTREDQMLFGIVQGGTFEDLRKKSAEVIGSMAFDGFGIGGSFGEGEMKTIIHWITEKLPEDKPRHLLGIGKIEDVFAGVEEGIDTFDCVIPTREARHASIWTAEGRVDLKRSGSRNNPEPLERGCGCPACSSGVTRGDLHAMFKEKDMRSGMLATQHNVYFFNTLMERIRESLEKGNFQEFKKGFLNNLPR